MPSAKPRKFLPVGYLLCNDRPFLELAGGLSGTLRVVVVYSIIYIKKKEKRTAEPSDQT